MSRFAAADPGAAPKESHSYYHVLLVYEDAQYGWQKVPNVNPPVVHVAPQGEGCGTNCPSDPRLTLDKTEVHPGDTLTVTVANAPAESDRVQIWTSGTCCRGLPAMDAVGLGTPKDGDIPLTAPQKPADYYVVLLGTPQEPDGSPHIITQSVEFRVLQCLPGEQGCAPAGTDTRWFYDTDAIGSVRLITDDAGGTFARYDYAPFGEPTLAENPDNQRRFAGKEFDAESRLNYFGARYFVAELGRFAAADPGQADGDPLNPQSWNAYAYSRNNPLRFVDPLGACSLDDAGNPVEDNESSRPIYAGSCIRFAAGASVSATSVSQLASSIAVQSIGMGEAALIQLLINDAFAGAGALVGGVFGSGLAGGEITGIGRIAPAAGRSGAFSVGQAGEAAVRSGFEIGAKTAIQVAGRVRIPDGLTNTVLSEVKNVRYLSYTQQLRDFATYAASRGLRFDLYVRPTTQLSGPLAEQVARGAINLRYIP